MHWRFALGLGALLSLLAVAWKLDRPTPAERKAQILRDAPNAPRGGALLIGDSITEAEDIDELCGLPVFNAGIAGTHVGDWTRLAPVLVDVLKPRIVVYALGVNDAALDVKFNRKEWTATYAALRGPHDFIMGVWPVEPSKNPSVSIERVAQMNDELLRHPRYIAPPSTPMTWDGVHLTWKGRAEWARRLRSICHFELQ